MLQAQRGGAVVAQTGECEELVAKGVSVAFPPQRGQQGGACGLVARLAEGFGGRSPHFPLLVPQERDDVELLVGIDRRFAEAVERAHRDLHNKAPCIVSGLTVRTLALGYLQWAGV